MSKVIGNSPDLANMFPKRELSSAWKSLESFARRIPEEYPKGSAWHDAGWDHDESFSGTKSMRDALKLAKDGWKEGAERIDKLSKLVYALHPIRKDAVRYGVAGSTPNVPRAIAGNPLNMKIPEVGKAKKRLPITIASNMAENCGVEAAWITNKAATLTAVIDMIEAKGFAVEVVALAGSNGRRGWFSDDGGREGFSCLTTVMIKESHHPLDKARIAFGLGHAAMFRRMVFADWGIEPDCKRLGGGLGSGGGVDPHEAFADKNIYIISHGGMDNFENDKTSAEKGVPWIIELLRSQGCPAFSETRKFTYGKGK